MRVHVPNPRIAVVIPCYNDGEFLRDAVGSLTGQEAHELVVVDDGSNDPLTVTVLRELESAGTRVLHQPNQGVSAARMAGVRATSAHYIFPLDGDDKVAPGALAALADALDRDPDAVVAWGDVVFFGMGQSSIRLPTPKNLDPWYITYVNEIPEASMVRRSALLATPGWQLTMGYEDWDLWLSLALHASSPARRRPPDASCRPLPTPAREPPPLALTPATSVAGAGDRAAGPLIGGPAAGHFPAEPSGAPADPVDAAPALATPAAPCWNAAAYLPGVMGRRKTATANQA